MKYGIQITTNDKIQYVSSTRSARPGLTTVITDIALFVQKTSAEKAGREIHKNGFIKDCQIDIISIDFTINKTDRMVFKPLASGFYLGVQVEDHFFFYNGTKKVSLYPQHHHLVHYGAKTILPLRHRR